MEQRKSALCFFSMVSNHCYQIILIENRQYWAKTSCKCKNVPKMYILVTRHQKCVLKNKTKPTRSDRPEIYKIFLVSWINFCRNNDIKVVLIKQPRYIDLEYQKILRGLSKEEILNMRNKRINFLFEKIFSFEKKFINKMSFPFGLSLIVIAFHKLK